LISSLWLIPFGLVVVGLWLVLAATRAVDEEVAMVRASVRALRDVAPARLSQRAGTSGTRPKLGNPPLR
jgi:cytochrome c-type biogenesis protein CcmH/NrfF